LQQQLQIKMTVSDNLYLNITGENYFTQSPEVAPNNILFADASVIWKINKLKLDIEIFLSNMLGNEHYSIIGVSENSIYRSVYSIRPRTVLFKYTFHF